MASVMSIITPLLIQQLPFFVADLILRINGQNVDKLALTGKWSVVGRIISSQKYCQSSFKNQDKSCNELANCIILARVEPECTGASKMVQKCFA